MKQFSLIKQLALVTIFFAFGACSSSKKEKSVMEPTTHGDSSMMSSSKTSGTKRGLSGKKAKDLRSLASEQENREACYRGDLEACAYVGKLYYERGNIRRASNSLKKSCDGGNPIGCYHLGNLEKGRDNLEEAEINFRKACDGGFFEGCVDLGHLFREEGNLDEATSLYRKACEGGYIPVCSLLGEVEEERGNTDEAVAAYELGCNGGEDFPICMKVMGLERERGNYREVESLYRRVCVERELEQNDFVECYNFALRMDFLKAKPWINFSISCSRPSGEADLRLRNAISPNPYYFCVSCFRGNPRNALDRRRYKKCIHIQNMREMIFTVRKKNNNHIEELK